ncbi:MAG: enoyl-CoA hydratase/isomerase family protein [Candidatus Tectomicrobia bacterium]|nr:enoyl-CoA hydratase/isomerase family protein [Candidatus Tectomicrobia bacterium]
MTVLVDKKGRILTITINRPEAMNALDPETRSRLCEAFEEFRDDDQLWVAVLTGAGEKSFCAGADIKKTIAASLDQTVWGRRKPFLQGRDLFAVLGELSKPVIAAVNGYALGGGLELALCCDIRVASERATFGLPEVGLGIIPGAGGTQRLSRAVGVSQALYMTLTGSRIDAQEAYRIGLVSRVVPPGELMGAALETAETICKRGPVAVRFAKEAILRGAGMTLRDGLLLENLLSNLLRGTKDASEATQAFSEKRAPRFTGE